MIKKVYQRNLKDCGVACLLSIIKFYKGDNTYENIRYLTRCDSNGITALNLIEASNKLGFNAKAYKCNYEDLEFIVKPSICHLVLENGYNHYVVLYKYNKKYLLIFDPYYGIKRYNKDYFIKIWDNICIELIPYRKLDITKESNYKIFLNILIKNRFKFILIIFISFLSIILTLITNLYFKTLIDGFNTIYILLCFTIVALIREVNNYIRNRVMINLETVINKELVINTHKKMLSLPNYYFSSRASGDIITKFNDLEHIKNLLIVFPISIIVDTTLIVITSIILINISKYLSIIFFTICFVYLLILIFYNKKIKNMININQESNSLKNTILLENINSIYTIKNMNIKEYRHNIFSNVFDLYTKNNIDYQRIYSKINLFKSIVLYVGINIILFLGIKLVNNNVILLSDLILFESLIIYFIEPLKDICDLSPLYKNGKNAMKRVSEIYLLKNSTNNEQKIYNFNIEFKNLNFSYDGYKKIFNNFNYKIDENSKVMVTGLSGKGKSTLFKLLNKSYSIDKNMIKIGNNDINDIDTSKYITYISQEENLFNDSIFNNIVLNNDSDKLKDVIKLTHFDKVLLDKNLDLNGIIEEDGSNLSKGEKQKIILSRALLKNSKIIILDESLSGVDEEEEYAIIKDIIEKFSDKTIIYISHSKVCINLFKEILDFDKIRRET